MIIDQFDMTCFKGNYNRGHDDDDDEEESSLVLPLLFILTSGDGRFYR